MRILFSIFFAMALSFGEAPRAFVEGIPVLDELPATTAEFKRRVRDFPSLTSIAAEGSGIYAGRTQLLLGDRIPIGPAPHTPWAKPLPAGKLNVIAVSTIHSNYDLPEIERRLDCNLYHMQVLQQYYNPKKYPEAFEGFLAEQALKTLERDADVILAAPNIRLFPERVSKKIAEKVRAGTGLVFMSGARYGGGNQYGYWAIKDKIETWKQISDAVAKEVDLGYKKFVSAEEHKVAGTLFHGVPFSLLPTHHMFHLKAAPGAEVLAADAGHPLAVGGRYGKGKVVLLNWATERGAFPVAEDNRVPLLKNYDEYYASAAIRAILWAAGRTTTEISAAHQIIIAGTSTDSSISLSQAVPRGTKIWTRLRDLRGRDIWSQTTAWKGQELKVTLPGLPGGTYLLDMIARDKNGASLGWSTQAFKVEDEGKLTIELDKDRYLAGEPARITAKVAGEHDGALMASLRITDALGRLVFHAPGDLNDGTTVQWEFPNVNPLSVVHDVEVEIFNEGRPLLKGRKDLFVPHYQPDDIYCWLWPGRRPDYAKDRVMRRQRELLGFKVIMGGGYGGTHRARNYARLTSGCLPFYSNVAPSSPLDTEKAPLKTRQKVLDMVDKQLPELRQFGGLAIFFQDERHGRGDSKTPTAEALTEFRKFLKPRYAGIAALNKAWGRNFRSFDEVLPVMTADFDAKKETSIAPWLEWRLWALEEVLTTDRLGAERIREAVGVPCNLGLEGIFGLATHNLPYGGTDLDRQSDFFNIIGPYGEKLTNASRSFYPDGFLFSWSGYNRTYSQYQRYIWNCAFEGHGGIGWWYGPIYYNSTDCLYPQARWVRDLSRPIREGIGKLLMENRPSQTDSIAFLYSQSSLYAMCILGKHVDPEHSHLFVRPAAWARRSMQQMFHDAGTQFGYISERQIQKSKGEGIKLLVLTSAVSLNLETCKALREFVANGGIVLADLCPGVWDDHGAYQSPGQLDDLFGIKREERFKFKTMVSDWGVGTFETEPDFNIKGQWFIGQYYEDTLKTSDGHALGKHIFGETKPPAFVFKRTGKGITILMNYLETEYRRVPEHWQQTLVVELLRLAKIDSAVVTRDVMRNSETVFAGRRIFRWQDGPARYVGLLLDEGRHLELEFKKGGHIYELASGQYLGKGKTAKSDLRDAPHALYAILPYKVDDLVVQAGPSSRAKGLALDIRIETDTKPARHVVHLDVFRPDGSRCHPLTRNVVLKSGRWTGTLPLALNDPTGRWTVKAREVVSGKEEKVTVRVKE
ncbi:MAG: beta-galactosidase [Planctomycetota bacterium]|nr:beta-galactosidase [Planctomycetota bacterium]